VRLTSTAGAASRCFIVGISVWPPESAWASSRASAFTASAMVEGFTNSKLCMEGPPSAVDRRPDPRRRDRHVDVLHMGETAAVERVDHGVDDGRGRADGPCLAAALHAQRIVGAGRLARVIHRV